MFVNSRKQPFIFPGYDFRTAALCLILILQNERWRQNVPEVSLSGDISFYLCRLQWEHIALS